MGVPFTADEFFGVFRAYNTTVWPAQVVLILAALAVLLLTQIRRPEADRIAMGVLGGLWIWTSLVYHLTFFADVNPAAYGFAVLFASEGVLLVASGRRLRFRARWDAAGIASGALILYALVVYPVLGIALGHRFPASPSFGAPCPLVIFTLGVLLGAEQGPPLSVLWIPVAWSVIGATAIGAFGMFEDLALPIAAAVAVIVAVTRRRQQLGVLPATRPQSIEQSRDPLSTLGLHDPRSVTIAAMYSAGSRPTPGCRPRAGRALADGTG